MSKSLRTNQTLKITEQTRVRVVVGRYMSVPHIAQFRGAPDEEPPQFSRIIRTLRSPCVQGVAMAPRGGGEGQVAVPFQSHSVPAVHTAHLQEFSLLI